MSNFIVLIILNSRKYYPKQNEKNKYSVKIGVILQNICLISFKDEEIMLHPLKIDYYINQHKNHFLPLIRHDFLFPRLNRDS